MKLLAALAVCFLGGHSAFAADLTAVYQRALQNDPQLREAEATRRAALESKPQALAALLPQLSASAAASRERDSGPTNLTENATVVGGPMIIESFPFNGRTTTNANKYGVDLKQNIFRWENWVALRRADGQVAQAEADYQAAQQDLIFRVAQRYFDVLAAQDDLDAQEGALASVSRQLEETEQRYAAGMIGITDVEVARASHDSTAAAVIDSKRQVASAYELLREITGDLPEHLARPTEPLELTEPEPSGEERWVQMALQQNPSLISSRLAADIAEENVSSAHGGHLPSLDLVASEYKVSNDGVSINTDGSYYGGSSVDQRRFTVGIQLTFPLFSGGMVASQVRQAVYQHRAAQDRVDRVTRQTERDARDAYLGVITEIARVGALRRALESSTSALEATRAGYDAGLRSATDVVESRRQWLQAKTDYSRRRYDYMMNSLRLQQAAGILSEESLARLNALLKE